MPLREMPRCSFAVLKNGEGSLGATLLPAIMDVSYLRSLNLQVVPEAAFAVRRPSNHLHNSRPCTRFQSSVVHDRDSL